MYLHLAVHSRLVLGGPVGITDGHGQAVSDHLLLSSQ
jgi:hypothetical protein